MQGTRGMTHQSAYLLQKAILMRYRTHDLFPPGLCADAECSQVWALKHGNALRKLVPDREIMYACEVASARMGNHHLACLLPGA